MYIQILTLYYNTLQVENNAADRTTPIPPEPQPQLLPKPQQPHP